MYVKRLLCSSSYAPKTRIILFILFFVALAWILYLQLTGQQHPFRRVNVRVIQRARAVQRLLGALLLLPNHFRPEKARHPKSHKRDFNKQNQMKTRPDTRQSSRGADGLAGAVMQKPRTIQKYFGLTTNRPTRQGVESRVRDKTIGMCAAHAVGKS